MARWGQFFLGIALLIGGSLSVTRPAAAQFFREGAPELSSTSAQQISELPHFSELVKDLSPAVVNISTETEVVEDDKDNQPQMPPFWRREPGRSLGSGFIVEPDGYIATNRHVIDKATKIIVRLLDDKTEYPAKLIGADEKTDLALIKIDSKEKLRTVWVGDSDSVQVGEWVLAIGNQFQLGQTVTAGIVSAKARKLSNMSGPYDQFLQTDASINPGSSGGPLFNTRGQVIGINSAIFSPGRAGPGGTGFNIGIGFSIPINLAKDVLTQIKDRGRVTRGLLGVMIQEVSAEIAQAMHLPTNDGALVGDVIAESPAGAAGIKRGDVITSFDGQAIRDHDDLPLIVARTPIGKKVKVALLRDGKSLTVESIVTEMKAGDPDSSSVKPLEPKKPNRLGLVLEDVSDDARKMYESPNLTGAVIARVEPGSPAFFAGLRPGEVIQEVGGQVITNTETFARALELAKPGAPLLLLMRRKEGTLFVTVKP